VKFIIAAALLTLLVIGVNLWTLSLVVLGAEMASVAWMIRHARKRYE
jgi:hypothetical protein